MDYKNDGVMLKVIANKLLNCLEIAPLIDFKQNDKDEIIDSLQCLFRNLTFYMENSVIDDLLEITLESDFDYLDESINLKHQFLIFQRANEIYKPLKPILRDDIYENMIQKFKVKTDKITMLLKCDYINNEWGGSDLSHTEKDAILCCLSKMNQILNNSGAYNFMKMLNLNGWSAQERWSIVKSLKIKNFIGEGENILNSSFKMNLPDPEYQQLTIEILNSQKFDITSEVKKLCFLAQNTVEKIISSPAFITKFNLLLPEITEFKIFAKNYLSFISESNLSETEQIEKIKEILVYFPDFEWYIKDIPNSLLPIFILQNESFDLRLKFKKELILILFYQASFLWVNFDWHSLERIKAAVLKLESDLKNEMVMKIVNFMISNGIDWKLVNYFGFGNNTVRSLLYVPF